MEPAATPAPRGVRDPRLRTGATPSAASAPAGSAFSGRTTPDTRPPDRDDTGHASSAQLPR